MCPAGPRPRALGTDACLGPRRARGWGDVEFQQRRQLDTHARRLGHRQRRTAAPWPRPRLACRRSRGSSRPLDIGTSDLTVVAVGQGPPTVRRRAIVIIQAVVGAAGLVGGLLLAARPDGSLLDAKRSALDGTPFSDWRAPGILLALPVGCGLLGASVWVWRRWPGGRGVALASAAGLVAFEVVQVLLIGFQGLQLLIDAIGTL